LSHTGIKKVTNDAKEGNPVTRKNVTITLRGFLGGNRGKAVFDEEINVHKILGEKGGKGHVETAQARQERSGVMKGKKNILGDKHP